LNEAEAVQRGFLCQGIRAVGFDLGGVLTTGLEEALKGTFRALGVPADRVREARARWWDLYREASLGRLTAGELWLALREAVDAPWPADEQIEAELLSRIHPREPGLPPLLRRLGRYYAVGLLSNHVSSWARFLLDRDGLTPYLQAAVISAEIGSRKPDPEGYLQLCARLGVEPSQAVYVADEQEDLEGCAAVGMTPVFIPGEDAVSRVGWPIHRVADLEKLLLAAQR